MATTIFISNPGAGKVTWELPSFLQDQLSRLSPELQTPITEALQMMASMSLASFAVALMANDVVTTMENVTAERDRIMALLVQ